MTETSDERVCNFDDRGVSIVNPNLYCEMALLEEKHWWFLGRRAIAEKIIEQLKLPTDVRLLDVGCGTGGNLTMLSRYGRLDAMELNDEARRVANSKNVTEVLSGKLPGEIPYCGEQFDLITLFDVLEHVENDTGALKELGVLLNRGGYLLITVPAYEFLWSKHDDVHHHYRRYLVTDLKKKITDVGLEVVYAGYFNTLLFPGILAARWIGKLWLSRGGDGSDLKMSPPWLNKLLFTLFASERWVIGHLILPFGVSALALATKP